MSLRITEGVMSRRLLADLRDTDNRVADAHRQVSTGKRVGKPSDDPMDALRAVRMRSEAAEAQQHQRNVDQARGWLDVTDGALADVTEALHRARELTVQAGNATYGLRDREAVAVEIDQLVGLIKQAGNARYGDAYVFAGQATTAAPYDTSPAGTDAYLGDGGPVLRTVGPGVSVQVNTPGSEVFGPNGAQGVVQVLRTVAAHLRSTDPADNEALRTSDLEALQAELDDVLGVRTTVGALSERLEAASERLKDVEAAADRFRSLAEDADTAEAYMTLTRQQSVYQAALRSGAQIIQPSLMDFLR